MTLAYIRRLWVPWQEIETNNRISDQSTGAGRSEYPSINVWLNGDDAELTAEIPGLDHEKIDISVSGDTVTLKGARQEEKLGEEDTYYRHGDFCKSIRLPFTIDANKVNAAYRQGVLKIKLSQAESEKPRRINIST